MNEFNTQICTSIEQSQRLLALGLKPETADCQCAALVVDWKGCSISNPKWRFYNHNKGFIVQNFERIERIPAWSMHRLIELLPKDIHLDDYADTHYYLTINTFKVIYVNSHSLWIYQRDEGCLYDKLIDTIEWTIKNNFFNKEYLKQ